MSILMHAILIKNSVISEQLEKNNKRGSFLLCLSARIKLNTILFGDRVKGRTKRHREKGETMGSCHCNCD